MDPSKGKLDMHITEDDYVEIGDVYIQENENIASSSSSGEPIIKIGVYHGTSLHEVELPAQASFGDVKELLLFKTGLYPQKQKLFLIENEKDDEKHLHIEGVKHNSKMLLLDDATSLEKKHKQAEVDEIAKRVVDIKKAVDGAKSVPSQEFSDLAELLKRQLLKLDSKDAEGETKRIAQVARMENLIDALKYLKERNDHINPFGTNDAQRSTSSASTSSNEAQEWESV